MFAVYSLIGTSVAAVYRYTTILTAFLKINSNAYECLDIGKNYMIYLSST